MRNSRIDERHAEDLDLSSADRRGGLLRLAPRATLIIRRLIGLALAMGMAYGIYHVIFRTDLLAPALAYVGPVQNAIDWVVADPSRAWMALAAIVIPHVGLYYMLFEDRK